LAVVREPSQVFVSRFRCPSEEAARSLVNRLLVAGLYPELHEPQLPDQEWEVTAPAELVPSEPNVADLRSDMRALADRSGAAFDGCDPDA
jgi:hypothetical protein